MVSKINLKARIERHSRVLKDNLLQIHPFKSLYHKLNYNIVLFLIVFLFPIYPLFSSFFYQNSEYDFYRWNIDESSILDSYTLDQNSEDISMIANDSYLSVNTVVDWKRDRTGYNEIIIYTIQSWDSFSSLAAQFWVTTNSIFWANNFDSKTILQPWQNIKIPPVSWLIHQVKKWDTISSLAWKYKVSEDKILAQNWLTINDTIQAGTSIIIPWAIKESPPKPKVIAIKNTKKSKNTKNWSQWGYTFPSGWESEFTDDNSDFNLVKRKPQWSFYWWNCTWYVAQYKNVNWSGNAREWLSNARAKWHSTGNNPSVWAIVVFSWKWYNPRYWHVWIVIDIKWDNIIVKDMNYRRLNEVTVRKVPKDDGAIRWYIYVD